MDSIKTNINGARNEGPANKHSNGAGRFIVKGLRRGDVKEQEAKPPKGIPLCSALSARMCAFDNKGDVTIM